MSGHLENVLAENIGKLLYFSVALDESTDINDMEQLVVFIREVTHDFEIEDEFLDLASMKSMTIGENLTQVVLKISKKLLLDPKNCQV